MHNHRPAADPIVRCYTGPITWAPKPNPAAYGNVCVTDVCSCGAVRRSNVNGSHVERGPWWLPVSEVVR